MRKSLFLIIALFAIVVHTSAQVMEWYTYWGSNVAGSQIQPVRMVVDNNGFVYTAALFGGSSVKVLDETIPSLSGVDRGDAIITKMTPEKVGVWNRKLVGSGTASVSDIVIDNDNNLVVTGTFTGTLQADATNSMTMQDPSGYAELAIFVIRYNSDGNVLNMWQLPAEEAIVNSVSVDGLNNIIISGTFGSEISFDPANLNTFVGSTQKFNQMFVAKYSATGSLIWAKYQQAEASFVNAFSKADDEGNVFVTGGFTGEMTLAGLLISTGTAVNDVFFVKYSLTGDESWAKHIKGSRSDRAIGVEISPIGDVAVLSDYYSEDITITGVADTLYNGFRNLNGTPTTYHMAVYTFNKDNGDYRWWYSYGQGSTVGGGGALGAYIRCTEEGVWYIGGGQSSRYGDLYTFDNFGNSNSGLRTVDGVWMQHNTNGGVDAIYLVLTRDGKLASIARPGGTQTENIKDIAISPDKKHVYMLYDIKARAAVMYTCVDNLHDSFTDLYTNFQERRTMYNLIQVLNPETPTNNAYTSAFVGFTSTIVAKYKFPEITPHELPVYTSGEEYSQLLAINMPAGVPQFYQLAIPEQLNFLNNTLIGTISGSDELTFGVLATDSTANPGVITYYAQDPNQISIRGRSRNVRYMSFKVKDDTSVRNLLAANATFYPSVTSDVLNIKTTETSYVVNIYSQVGQLVGKHNNPTSINVNDLPAGIYYVQLKSINGAVNTAKFIIE